jgi:hypothetical protein
MGKLLVGHYGGPPEAESISISLRECHQRLGMRPTDFVSAEEPPFFHKKHKSVGKYLVFQADATDVQEAAVWRPGYYLLPLDAAEVLRAFNKADVLRKGAANQRPFDIECKSPVPSDVLQRVEHWNEQSQPLLFQCHCPQLVIRLDPPTFIRRRWKVRLGCRKRCQPPIKSEL